MSTEKEQEPMSVTDVYWLFEQEQDIPYDGDFFSDYDLDKWIENSEEGKWMMLFPRNLINKRWKHAKTLYRKGKLPGVESMKCSTAKKNDRSSDMSTGVIIFYCGGYEEWLMKIGRNILKQLPYHQRYMYFKTNVQTHQGTIATGSKKNHTYKILNDEIFKNHYQKHQCFCGGTYTTANKTKHEQSKRHIKWEQNDFGQ